METGENKVMKASDKKEVFYQSTPVPARTEHVSLENISDDMTFMLRLKVTESKDLSDDIKWNGQKIPILIRPMTEEEGKYQIIAGFRRFASLKGLGAKTVLGSVYEDLADMEAFRLAMGENMQRDDYAPEDILNAVVKVTKKLKEENGGKASSRDVAPWVGLSYKTVQRYWTIARYPELKEAVVAGKMSVRKALGKIGKLKKDEDLSDQVKKEELKSDEALKAIEVVEATGTRVPTSYAEELVSRLDLKFNTSTKFTVGIWSDKKDRSKDKRTINILNMELNKIDMVFDHLKRTYSELIHSEEQTGQDRKPRNLTYIEGFGD